MISELQNVSKWWKLSKFGPARQLFSNPLLIWDFLFDRVFCTVFFLKHIVMSWILIIRCSFRPTLASAGGRRDLRYRSFTRFFDFCQNVFQQQMYFRKTYTSTENMWIVVQIDCVLLSVESTQRTTMMMHQQINIKAILDIDWQISDYIDVYFGTRCTYLSKMNIIISMLHHKTLISGDRCQHSVSGRSSDAVSLLVFDPALIILEFET